MTWLSIGLLLGGPVGVGTLIVAVLIGPAVANGSRIVHLADVEARRAHPHRVGHGRRVRDCRLTGRRRRRFSGQDRFLDATVGMAGESGRDRPVRRIVGRPRPPAELRALVVVESGGDLGARVHHERPVLGDWLADRTPLEHEQLDRSGLGHELDGRVGGHHGTRRSFERVPVDREPAPIEHVQGADGVGVACRWHRPPPIGVELRVPDRNIGVATRRPTSAEEVAVAPDRRARRRSR